MNWEEHYCQAERDYDAHREELLMTTKDDQIDNSKWQSFFETDVRYWSDPMLKQAMGDLIDEQNARPTKEYQSEFLKEFGKVGRDLRDAHKEHNRSK